MTNTTIGKLRKKKEHRVNRNMKLINASENDYDIFDKLVIIEGWFEKFTGQQQINLLEQLEDMIGK